MDPRRMDDWRSTSGVPPPAFVARAGKLVDDPAVNRAIFRRPNRGTVPSESIDWKGSHGPVPY